MERQYNFQNANFSFSSASYHKNILLVANRATLLVQMGFLFQILGFFLHTRYKSQFYATEGFTQNGTSSSQFLTQTPNLLWFL